MRQSVISLCWRDHVVHSTHQRKAKFQQRRESCNWQRWHLFFLQTERVSRHYKMQIASTNMCNSSRFILRGNLFRKRIRKSPVAGRNWPVADRKLFLFENRNTFLSAHIKTLTFYTILKTVWPVAAGRASTERMSERQRNRKWRCN